MAVVQDRLKFSLSNNKDLHSMQKKNNQPTKTENQTGYSHIGLFSHY